MNHLERLIGQYYEWQGYIVRLNTLVGRRPQGGYECELDICAFHPGTNHLVHVEPSLDAHNWQTREARFTKKFQAGSKHIKSSVFPWLNGTEHPIEQIAVLIASAQNHSTVGGGKVVNLDEFVSEVRTKVQATGVMSKNAIPERYDLLRTMQLLLCGYYRIV
jgi:hypothetical protein